MWSASSRHARLCTVLTALRHWEGHRKGWGDSALLREGESWVQSAFFSTPEKFRIYNEIEPSPGYPLKNSDHRLLLLPLLS